jgi:hypothetical protein
MSEKPTEEEPLDSPEELFPLVCDGIAVSLGIPPRIEREWTEEEQNRVSAEFDRAMLTDELFLPQTGRSPGQR